MSTNLTPAEQTRRRLIAAERLARAEDWEEYHRQEAEYRKARFNLRDPDSFAHGTPNGYTYYKCRCTECRAAWADYMRDRNRKIREARPKSPRPAPQGRAGRVVKDYMHGTGTGYAYGCRCDKCKMAKRSWAKKKRTKQHGTEYVYRLGCRCRPCTQAATVARRRRRNRELDIPVKVHGTEKAYTHGKCRCPECTRAHRESVRRRVREMREYYREHPEEIPQHVHGTENGYTAYGCRCPECRARWAEATRNRRARKRLQDARQKGDS